MVIENTNDREVKKTQTAGNRDKSYLKNKGDYDEMITPKDKDLSELDDHISKDIDFDAMLKDLQTKTETKGVVKKIENVSLSVKRLFEGLKNPDSIKYSFQYSAVRDTPYGRAIILTNTDRKIALFIGLDNSVLGQTLEKKGYEKSLNLGSSGYIVIDRVESKNKQTYYMLNDIMLKTKMPKGSANLEI